MGIYIYIYINMKDGDRIVTKDWHRIVRDGSEIRAGGYASEIREFALKHRSVRIYTANS